MRRKKKKKRQPQCGLQTDTGAGRRWVGPVAMLALHCVLLM